VLSRFRLDFCVPIALARGKFELSKNSLVHAHKVRLTFHQNFAALVGTLVFLFPILLSDIDMLFGVIVIAISALEMPKNPSLILFRVLSEDGACVGYD